MSSLLGEDIDTLKYFFYDEMFCILRNILDFCVTRLQIVYKVYIVNLPHMDTVHICSRFCKRFAGRFGITSCNLPHHFSPVVQLVKSTVLIAVCSYIY
jgi:hypothetical protein